MESSAIREELIKYIFNKSDLKSEDLIPLDQSLLANGVLDSFAVVELVEFIESNWSIHILDSEFNQESMGSINKMVDLIYKKTSQQ